MWGTVHLGTITVSWAPSFDTYFLINFFSGMNTNIEFDKIHQNFWLFIINKQQFRDRKMIINKLPIILEWLFLKLYPEQHNANKSMNTIKFQCINYR